MNEQTKPAQQAKPVVLEELAIANIRNLLIARARARRDLNHAIHAFCLRYDLMAWIATVRKYPMWWRYAPPPRMTSVSGEAAHGVES